MAQKNQDKGVAGAVPAVSDPGRVRNVVLVGHSGAGTTSLVEALLAVAAFRIEARRRGVHEVVANGAMIRFAPADLPDSAQLRLNRLYPGSLVRKASSYILVPRPMTRPIGGQPVTDAALLAWAVKVLGDVFGPVGTR